MHSKFFSLLVSKPQAQCSSNYGRIVENQSSILLVINFIKGITEGEKEVAMGSSFMGSMVKLWRIGIAITRLNLNFTRFKINSALDTIFLGNV